MIRFNFIILIISGFFNLNIGLAQNIELDRVLVGSGYSEFSSSTFNLSASVGEPIISTETTTNLIITQGFQQSNYILKLPFILDLVADSAACLGANDGSAGITFISSNITSPYTYLWSNGDTTAIATNLEVGIYSVTVTGSNGNSVTNSAEVFAVEDVDCKPRFYTGITPNGDGLNDSWFIENADFFTQKKLEVFNRYGIRVWRTDDYDNVSDFFNGTATGGGDLTDGAYFYVAEFDNSTYRGYIEIAR